MLGALGALLALASCVSRPEPDPASFTTAPPPWPAPRDAISHIRAAGLEEQPLDTDDDPWIVALEVEVGGTTVDIPPYIGVDRLRAVQAPVHTHDAGGDVWLEGPGTDAITLGDFFMLWGVSFDGECLASTCGVEVTADGEAVDDPAGLVLRGVERVVVRAGD